MNTDLGYDSVDQLAFRQREIKIMVTGRMLLSRSVI